MTLSIHAKSGGVQGLKPVGFNFFSKRIFSSSARISLASKQRLKFFMGSTLVLLRSTLKY